jgi:hypothetical protein
MQLLCQGARQCSLCGGVSVAHHHACDPSNACVPCYTNLYVQGFDNLYVLTGGLQAFCELHPNYIEGTPPEPKVQPRGSSSSSSNRGTPQRRSSTGSTIAGSVRGRCVQHFCTTLVTSACSMYACSRVMCKRCYQQLQLSFVPELSTLMNNACMIALYMHKHYATQCNTQ